MCFCVFVVRWGVSQCVSLHMDTLEWLDRGWGISKAGKGEEEEEKEEEEMCASSQGVFEK